MVRKDSRITALTSLTLILEMMAALGIGLFALTEVSSFSHDIGIFVVSKLMVLSRGGVQEGPHYMFQRPSAQQATLLPP